jgi:hypothetical protein
MAVSQSIRKKARSGRVMRSEPQDLELINEDPTIRASFEQARCMRFCENIKGYNAKLAEQFTLNFTGVSATIAGNHLPSDRGNSVSCDRDPSMHEKNGLKACL